MTLAKDSIAARDVASLIHPYTNLKAHESTGPLVIRKGRGIYVYDDAGKEYIEGLASLWYTSLGFSEERLIQAAMRQMHELPTYHVFASKSHEPAVELADGTREWYLQGRRHRFGQRPAIERPDGSRVWYSFGYIGNFSCTTRADGVPDDDKPARIDADGFIVPAHD